MTPGAAMAPLVAWQASRRFGLRAWRVYDRAMNLRDLRYLVAVAEHRHFGKAADACFVSQPTLSTQIKKLEEFLGVQLVERSNKQVMLTAAGTQVVERARRVLHEVDDLVELCRASRDPLSGEIRLGFIPTIAPYLLPHLVAELRRQLPRLRPLLYEDQTARLVDRLRRGEVDAALMAIPVDAPDLRHEELFAEPFMLALPSEHPLTQKRALRLDDLRDQRVLLLDEGHCLRDQALDICNLLGVRQQEEFRATSLETLRQMVASGAGITFMPALAAEANAALPNSGAVQLRAFEPPQPDRHMALYWRKGSAREHAVAAIGDVIRSLPAVRALRS
jgi:LysR family hydrogen peroxide-inducible transcriptional activator